MNKQQLAIFKIFLASDIGFWRYKNLIEVFKDPENILKASKQDLIYSQIVNPKTAENIISASKSDEFQREIDLASKKGIDIVTFDDKNYPQALKDYDDKPLVLYIKGSIKDDDLNSISIIGSRKISIYGKRATREFASFFANNSITIISGLARGVDSQAHITALENKGRSIGVLGNGLLVNYPPENAKLQESLSENGAIVSEFSLLRNPDKTTFPRRNRIIAALSKVTLVIEASKKSGALISAKYAAQYGKDVFAIPQNIYSESGAGTNYLIQNGAEIALSPQDMAERISFLSGKHLVKENKKIYTALNNQEKSVIEIIEQNSQGIHIDSIAEKLDLSVSNVAFILLNLELNGLVENLPGQIYIKKY